MLKSAINVGVVSYLSRVEAGNKLIRLYKEMRILRANTVRGTS
jgi:hypothetical protein